MKQELEVGWGFRVIRSDDKPGDIEAVVLQPTKPTPATGYPLVIRIGHPRKLDRMIRQLLVFKEHLPADEPVLMATTDVLRLEREMPVESKKLWKEVPPRFDAWLEDLVQRYPIDKNRIYLTGFSFDAVWAWMLAYRDPTRYAAVVALSSVSYPDPIQNGVREGIGVPTCVLRGEKDPLFPKLLAQEQETGKKLLENNPVNVFRILPGVDHSAVWKHADTCLRDWLLKQHKAPKTP